MTKRKLFWLLLIFVIYELVVWAASIAFFESNYLLVGFVLTVSGVTVLLVYILVSRLSHAAPPRPAQESSPPPAPSVASAPINYDEQSDAVAGLIRESNERLANSKKLAARNLNRAVTDLPLYFLIGPEGGGKTSLFLSSKLEPELLAGQDYRDSAVVGTRLGNIWFAEESIVVEAAGSLFSGDATVWSRFLAAFRRRVREYPLLKTFRSSTGSNLSGVVLCCDATAFVGVPDATRLGALARLAQQRLRAVGEVFGFDFPVYVVFSKADAIPFFAEYFGRLSLGEDQQPLGCSLATTPPAKGGVYDVAETARISAALNKLYLSLADNRLEFLARETDRARKPAVYEFPREFRRIRGPLTDFLVEVFRPNPLQPNPRLEGFYFTGTRKVAASVSSGPAPSSELDPMVVTKVGDVTRILRAQDLQKLRTQAVSVGRREPDVTRWSFVPDLWMQIMRSGQGAVPAYVDLKRQARRKAAFIAAAAVCTLFGLLFINSFFQNRSLVHGVRTAALESKPVSLGSSPSLASLRGIDNLRTQVAGLTNSGPSLFLRFGFYQGNELKDPAQRLYFTRFGEYFLNGIVARLETDLASLPAEQNSAHPYDAVYRDLKTYRMITKSPAEASCPPESALAERLLAVWAQNRPPDAEAEGIARVNFQFFTEALKAKRIPEGLEIPSKDDRVVTHSREYLSRFQSLEPQYQRIVEQVNEELRSPARLQDLTHDTKYRAVLRVQEEVPGAFTRAGWDRVQKLIEGASAGKGREGCVLGSGGPRLPTLLAGDNNKVQLRDMYIRDYIQHWQQFLSQAGVVPSTGCGDAAEKLNAFEARTSPILAALALAAQNTTFPKHTATATEQVTQAVSKKANSFFDRLRKPKELQTAAQRAGVTTPAALTEDDITNTFQPVHAVFESSPPDPEHWIDKRNTPYLDALGDLQHSMETLDQGEKCSTDPGAQLQANEQAGKALRGVEQLARNFYLTGTDDSVKTLLELPIKDAQRWIKPERPGEQARRAIEEARGGFCVVYSPLLRKYPFNRKTEEDANPNEVAKVFAAQGSKFADLKQALGDNVTNSGGVWAPKPDAPIKLSRTFLDFFNRASAISRALFQATAASMHYKLAAVPNPAVKQVVGPIDGVTFSMTEKEYAWPSSTEKIDLRVIQADGGNSPLRGYSGPWAIFRLLSAADRIAGHQFYLVYLQGGGGNPQAILPDGAPIILEVTQYPNGVESAFDPGFFQLSCPGRATE